MKKNDISVKRSRGRNLKDENLHLLIDLIDSLMNLLSRAKSISYEISSDLKNCTDRMRMF